MNEEQTETVWKQLDNNTRAASFRSTKIFLGRTNKKSDVWYHKQSILSVKPNRKSKNLRLSNEKLQTRDQIIGSYFTNWKYIYNRKTADAAFITNVN